jgi:uncharacterized lipoprotein YmbA
LPIVTCGAVVVLLFGCATTTPSKFYTLHALTSEVAGERSVSVKDAVGVGIGPLSLPALLDRPQIVIRTSSHELRFAEFDRWAEPLDQNLYRVLTENMSILLNTDHVYAYPWKSSAKIDYQVAIDVIRFDVTSDGEASLVARWTVYGGEGREVLLKKKSHFKESASAKDYHSLVSALNKTLEDFSHEVAESIKSLPH